MQFPYGAPRPDDAEAAGERRREFTSGKALPEVVDIVVSKVCAPCVTVTVNRDVTVTVADAEQTPDTSPEVGDSLPLDPAGGNAGD